MEAHLPMYELSESLARLNDEFWNILRDECRRLLPPDVDIPLHLSHQSDAALDVLGESGKLFFGQTCGLPLCISSHAFTVVGIPRYKHRGECKDGDATYCSVIVASAASGVQSLEGLRGRTVAVNSSTSLSGSLLFAAAVGHDIAATLIHEYSGSHMKSLEFVQKRLADAAAIDVVSFELISRHFPSLVTDLNVLGLTPNAPSLPFVTSSASPPEVVAALRTALATVMNSCHPAVVAIRSGLLLESVDIGSGEGLVDKELFNRYCTRIIQLRAIVAGPSLTADEEDDKLSAAQHADAAETNSEVAAKLRPLLPEDAAFASLLIDAIHAEVSIEHSRPTLPAGTPATYVKWSKLHGDRDVRIVLPGGFHAVREQMAELVAEGCELDFVCFLGTRPRVESLRPDDHNVVSDCWKYDKMLVDGLDPGLILAYATASASGPDWGNVVLFRRNKNAVDFLAASEAAAHTCAVTNVAPLYYEWIRIHRGSVVLRSGVVRLRRTLFVRYVDCGSRGVFKRRRIVQWTNDPTAAAVSSTHGEADGSSLAFPQYSTAPADINAGALEAQLDMFSDCNKMNLPAGFQYVVEDYVFDPCVHFTGTILNQLVSEVSVACGNVEAFGYSEDELASFPSVFGQSSTFQVLSESGIAALRTSLTKLDKFAQTSKRIPKVLRAAAHRSRFIRDLSASVELCQFVSTLAGCSLAPHPMVIHHGHSNLLACDDAARREAVDAWHRDTVAFVLVIFVSDTCSYQGGQFQFFDGSCAEAESILMSGRPLPSDRVKGVGTQQPGSAVFQQGSRVYHRAAPTTLDSTERTTVVLSYVACDAFRWDSCTALAKTYNEIDPWHVLVPEWVRSRLWKAQRALLQGIQEQPAGGSSRLLLLASFCNIRLLLLQLVKRLPYTSKKEYLLAKLDQVLSVLNELLSAVNAEDEGDCRSRVKEENGGVLTLRRCVLASVDTVRSVHSDVLLFQPQSSEMIYFK